ncbi:MAG: selenium-dependent molybdenum cofactor biosynthesis protein YqeB [Ilumatobacter sp.]|uniref:selenium-dependent molybdenum cofactor biosynthesis protein YqeB n=1 Tax=Ilumatobacter sp. TaxID=1967498 RepID=UPI002633D3A5|nr:selenium-dependent molybdenum cofactor biosynthesis protein YqeB [Ilumatobacter sp.]MDJ0767275.1 selenium-dependent molybdenum cofactor biosynthesis protein YqeB [Ilumatobacter sp.]
MPADLCLIRGGGDLATGVAWRLSRCGFPVIVTELAEPLSIRRTVALSSAVQHGVVDVEGLVGRRASSTSEACEIAERGDVAVLVSASLPDVAAPIVVDARLAKEPLDTTIDDAPLVVALGPGFVVGTHCHAVVETQRGHHLGRVLWEGSAQPDTGTPGVIGGRGTERVVRAPGEGLVSWHVAIGDLVAEGEVLGLVGSAPIRTSIDGVVRGTLAPGMHATAGLKIADIDPRSDPVLCREISDKALAIGGGVVEAVFTWSPSR